MREQPAGFNHARLIESTLHGRQPATVEVDQVVRRSWSRCLDSYALDPIKIRRPKIVERSDLKARCDRMGAVLQIARIEIMLLARQLLNEHIGIMLTDRDGVILCYVGDPGFSDVARRSGLREGAIWSESEFGTNGMGTCLVTQHSIIIHKQDHFLAQNTELTCTAAPIFDAQGNVLAALDISGQFAQTQLHTLALVEIAAQNIENRAMLDACRDQYLLRFHSCPEFISTPGEGVIAVNDSGIVTGANRGALDLLGYPRHDAVCGLPIEQVFETSMEALQQLSERPAFRPERIMGHGRMRNFVVVQAPQPRVTINVEVAHKLPLESDEPEDALAAMGHGDSALKNNIRIARRVLNRDISVLLLGETGTGKGYFAKALHQSSERADEPFVSVNCAAIPELLIESELFGYKPGAFTGATRQGHPGRILQANGGTLFLDEIGDMPLSLQARLLSVIEDREVMPLGGTKPVAVDVRIISATHRDLVEMIAKGLFRDDLYYRLNGITLTMPPLRERQDFAGVIRSLLKAEAGQGPAPEIEDALIQRLARHPWHGNLRQLRNVLRTMMAMSESNRLGLGDFDETLLPEAAHSTSAPSPVQTEIRATEEDDDVLGHAERDALLRTLESCHWNVSAAAQRLNVSRKTMYRKMHRHGLHRQATVDEESPGGWHVREV